MALLHATIFDQCNKYGKRTMMSLQKESGGYRHVSWADFRERSLRISAFLKSKGIGKGDRVLLVSENAPEWTMAALGAMNCGATVVPVASIASFLEIQNILREAAPKFCFVSDRCAAAKQLKKDYNLPHLFWDIQQGDVLEDIYNAYPPAEPLTHSSEDDPAVLIFTSGTTGTPKAVPISHRNILVNAGDAVLEIEASERDRLVSVLPLSHMFEFTGGFVTPALIGAELTYVKSLRAEDLLQALRDTKATIMLGVPLLFEIIGRNLQSKMQDAPASLAALFGLFEKIVRRVPSLGPVLFFPIHRAFGAHIRYFMAGGSRLQPAVYDFFKGIGITILQGYGLTETSPVLSVTNLRNSAPDHVGRPMRSIELEIFNDKGEKLPAGVEGEIWARGPSIFKGYMKPEHNKDVFFGDWFRTGDLGTLDAEGILRITGRKKDIIVTSAGKNVYPEEIEGVVLGTGKFLEACVLGLNDGSGHEKICLVLVPDKAKFLGQSKEETAKSASALAQEATRALSDYKWPQKVEVLFEELPKTVTRKIKKHEVRKILEARAESGGGEKEACTAGASLNLEDELESTVADGISAITKIDPAKICLADSLTKDLGLDSLTFVELVSVVEKRFSTQIEGVDFATIFTVEDLLKVLAAATASRRKKKFFNKVFFVDFDPKANQRAFFRVPRRFGNIILRVLLLFRYGLTVKGLKNLGGKGPFLFTPNHASHFDTLAIVSAIPPELLHRTFAVAAKDYFFNKSFKALFSRVFINAIPFDRKGRVDESMRQCRDILSRGDNLTIFPEGTRSPDGKLQAFKPGVGQLLAGHPNARAVPVYIRGAFEIMPKGKGFPGPGRLEIIFGKPISFSSLKPEAESYKKIAERLREEVVALSKQ